MKAVNLIPSDTKRSKGGRATVGTPRGPAVALIGGLVIALTFATIYVLTSNTINDRKAKLATVQNEVTAAQAQATKLTNYANFVKLASSRFATVSQIATQRFDWHAALSDLSKVVPPNTSLQSLLGTVSPSAGISGAGGSTGGSAIGTGTLRSTIAAPAFELRGCTKTQDDVARLISNLRLINGVTRVTLADATTPDGSGPGGAAVGVSSTGTSGGCPANGPSFDLVVFFQPLPGESSTATTPGTSTTSTTTTSTSTTTSASPSTTASAPATAPTVSATATASSTAAPVSSAPGGSK